MSKKLSFCVKAAISLDDQDLSTITESIEHYQRAGMSVEQSEAAAVSDMIAAVTTERADMVKMLRTQHPDLFLSSRPPLPEPKKARARVQPIRGSMALGQISVQLDGLSPDLLPDLSSKVERTRVSKTGKRSQYTTWDNPPQPGVGPLFRKGGTADMSEVARVLEEEGYMEPGTIEADPIGATQRAQAIVKAELAKGGSTVRIGAPEEVEAEMQRRQDMANELPDDVFDGIDDDAFEQSGYADLPPEVKALTEQLLAQAEAAGLDTETMRERAAMGDPTDADYHAQLDALLTEALASAAAGPEEHDASAAPGGREGGRQPAEGEEPGAGPAGRNAGPGQPGGLTYGGTVQEPGASYTTDLFGTDLEGAGATQLPTQRAAAQTPAPAPTATPTAGALNDTPAPEGNYQARTIVGSEIQRELGAARITTPAEAAAATQYLYRNAVERFDGIVVDKNGKPLAVVGGFKGALAQASVYPSTLVGEAVRVPGAAAIWFSHNHPSGSAQLSNADKHLNQMLADVFRGSGIEPKGLLAIGEGRYHYVDEKGKEAAPWTITKLTASSKVPVIERQLANSKEKTVELTSPLQAKTMAKKLYEAGGNRPGLLLTDAQLHVVAWVPLPAVTTGKLRDTGGLNALYRAVSEANAGAAFIVHGGELDVTRKPPGVEARGITASQNIAAALKAIDVRPIDSINVQTGKSAAETGERIDASTMLDLKDDASADFQDTQQLERPEVIEGDAAKQDVDALAKLEASFKGKVDAFKSLKLRALPRMQEPGKNASQAERERYAAVDLAEKLFGKRVVFFNSNIAFANGMMADYLPGMIFINENTTRPIMAVLGHEILHSMRQSNPALYERLHDRLRAMLEEPGKYHEQLNRRRDSRGLPPLSYDKLREELLADIVGDNFTDPAFWRQMTAGQPTLFGRVLRVIRDFLDDLLAKLRNERPYGTNQYLNDVQGARDAVVEAMRAFGNDPKTAAAAVTTAAAANLSEADSTDTPAFKRWFDGSKVTTQRGEPMVVYHGAPDARFVNEDGIFKTLNERYGHAGSNEDAKRAFFFTDSRRAAATYADDRRAFDYQNAEAAVVPAYLALKNPLIIDAGGKHWREAQKRRKGDVIDEAKANGHDGVIIRNVLDDHTTSKSTKPIDVFVAFASNQIKSPNNSGAFDPTNPDIRMSLSGDEGNFAWHLLTDPKSVGEQLQQHFGRELAAVTPLEIVDGAVLGALQNDQVRRAVVEAVPVDVVNVLADNGLTAEGLLREPDVVGKNLPVEARATVAAGLARATTLVGARLRAELRRVLSAETGLRDEEVLPAVRASELDPSVVVRLLSGARGDEALGTGLPVGEATAARGAEPTVSGLDDAGVGGELSLAQLALFLNRHDAIVRGDPANVVEKYVAPDAAGGLPMFSLQHTPEEEAALAKAGINTRTRLQRAGDRIRQHYTTAQNALRSNWAAGFQQGALDQFTGINRAIKREIGALPRDQDPYVAARLANGGTSSVMRGLMLHGQARWAANGQHLEKIPDTEGLLDILKPLGPRLNDFFGWMIGNRAERLMKEGRENNFTADDIKALKGLNKGMETEFRAAALKYAAFKRTVLDVAEQAGLLDPESRKVWDNADYIPFYREIDEKAVFGATGKKGLAGQSSGIRTLKGGEAALNDPMENILMNFSRLVDASLKNRALRSTIDVLTAAKSDIVDKVGYSMAKQVVPANQVRKQLEAAGTPQQILDIIPPEAFEGMAKMWAIQAPTDPDVVRVMRNGKPEFYKVNDPLLLKALTSFVPFDFPGLGVARAFKRVLTGMVTVTPDFMLRNWIRDTAATAIITRDGFNPIKSLSGVVKSYREAGAFEDLLFAGASFQSGHINAADPVQTGKAMRRALREKGFDASSTSAFIGSILDTPMRFFEKYKHVGESIENGNREAVYEAARTAGKSPTAAAFESKDLMDFSLRGSSPFYQLLADVLPFFNARVQGLYRLGRADPKRVALYGTLMMVATLALAYANGDNDDYDKLPDWDKETYWHFWIKGEHFRMPKPFELGAVFASIPERIMRYTMGQDTGKKSMSRLWAIVRDQLAFDPVPQLIRPVMNTWANKDTFRDRPIENQGDEGKLPSMRYSKVTSPTAVAAVKAIAPVADEIGLSPKKLEYLVGGYLGTAGLYALGLSDMAVSKLRGDPVKPATRLDQLPIIGSFYRQEPATSTVYESDLYKMRTEVDQIYKSVRALKKDDKDEESDALAAKHEKELDARKTLERGAKKLTSLNKQRDEIYADRTMTREEKRKAIDELLRERAEVSKDTMKSEEVINAR